MRLAAPELPRGMQLTQKQTSAVAQDPRSLGEDRPDTFDMLENQIADHEVERCIAHAPLLPNVGTHETDVIG